MQQRGLTIFKGTLMKITLYVYVHIKTILAEFRILNTKNYPVIWP